MTITDWIQAISMLVLVIATGIYAWRTFSISRATKQQADASIEMTEEMRGQRVMASRPVIIQKAVVETETEFATFGSKDWFSYFEVYNAGNGPAIEPEISLLDRNKRPIRSRRETFLRASEQPIIFSPSELTNLEKSSYYLVTEYQSIFSRGPKQTWYQTWLPFEAVEGPNEGIIYLNPGELEFEEVTGNERINLWDGSKPK